MFQNIPGLGPVPMPGSGPTPPLACWPGLSCSPPVHLLERNNRSVAFNRGRLGAQLERQKSKQPNSEVCKTSSERGSLIRGDEHDRRPRTGPRGPQRSGRPALCTCSFRSAPPLDLLGTCPPPLPKAANREGEDQTDVSICDHF